MAFQPANSLPRYCRLASTFLARKPARAGELRESGILWSGMRSVHSTKSHQPCEQCRSRFRHDLEPRDVFLAGDKYRTGRSAPRSLKSLIQNVKSEAEKNAIGTALKKTGWNRKAAARLLQVSYRTLLYKIDQYHMTSAESFSVFRLPWASLRSSKQSPEAVGRSHKMSELIRNFGLTGAIFACALSTGLWSQDKLANLPSQSPKGGQAEIPAGAKLHDDSFVIGNDDVLAINVWKEPDVSRSIPVRSDGKISLPLVGEVQAAGLTPLKLEQDIAGRLKNYISDRSYSHRSTDQQSEIQYSGASGAPELISLAKCATVLDAIAIAGGL